MRTFDVLLIILVFVVGALIADTVGRYRVRCDCNCRQVERAEVHEPERPVFVPIKDKPDRKLKAERKRYRKRIEAIQKMQIEYFKNWKIPENLSPHC